MSRDEAREALIAVRKMLAQGKDPSQERKLERIRTTHPNAQTFQAIFDEWVASRTWAATTKRNRLAQIEFHVLPYLGPLPVREISPMHVLDVLRRAEKPAQTEKKSGRGARVRDVGRRSMIRGVPTSDLNALSPDERLLLTAFRVADVDVKKFIFLSAAHGVIVQRDEENRRHSLRLINGGRA